MAKQTINVGRTPNDKSGDSLRIAFQKVNANFSELYNNLGLDGTVFDPLNVDSNIVPTTDNTYDLGSPAKQWRHVYTAGGSIYLDNIKLTNNAGKLEITKVINPGQENEAPDPEDSNAGDSVTSKLTNGEHTFTLTEQGTLELDGDPFTGGNANTGNFIFDGNVMAILSGLSITNADGVHGATAALTLPANGTGDVELGNLYGAVVVTTGTDNENTKAWIFGSDGQLTLPVNVAGDSVLYSTAGNVELYSNNETAQVKIRAKGGDGDNEWIFNNDGDLTVPGGIKSETDNDLSIQTESLPTEPPTTIEIVGADFVAVNLTYTQSISDPNAWIPADYNPSSDPYIQYANGQYGIQHPAFGQPIYVNTGTLNVPLVQWNTNPPLGSVPPTGVYTYPNTYTRNWSFGTDGSVTIPNGGKLGPVQFPTGNEVYTEGNDSYSQLNWDNTNFVWVDNTGASVQAGNKIWEFTSNGAFRLPVGGDIVNSSGNSVLGGSGAVVERSISFPAGQSGDTRGTIALTPDGDTYICTDDWIDNSSQYQNPYSVENSENYGTYQSGDTVNQIAVLASAEPDLLYIYQNANWNPSDFTIDAGVAFGGVQTCSNLSYNGTTLYFQWPYRAGIDPTTSSIGDPATIVYSGTVNQAPIWKKLVDLTSPYPGEGNITWTNQGDLTIETVRPEGYTGDCDINLYAADDIWMEANGDQIQVKAKGQVDIISRGSSENSGTYVRIQTDYDAQTKWWTFTKDGSLQVPTRNNTGYQNGYSLNAPTLMLGGENDPYDQVIITGPVPNSNSANAQRLVIQGQRGYGTWQQPNAGEGGDVYIWGGTGGEGTFSGQDIGGSGGDIKIRGGQGQNNAGGYVKIEGGSAQDWNGGSNTGGYIEISGGDALGGNGNGGDVNIRGGHGVGTGNNGVVWVRTGQNSEHQWQFDNGGVLHLPTGGDIVDSNGDSVLGAGAPVIPSTVKGWYQIQGLRPNNNNEVLWQTVAVTPGGESFTAGKNYYSNPRGDATIVIQKHSTSGEVLLSKRIGAGYGATFTVVVAGGVLSITGVTNLGGQGYQVNEKLVMWGATWSDYSYASIWTLNVDSVDEEGNGAILTASVVDQPITPPADGIYNFVSPVKSDLTLYANSMVYNNECEQVFLSAEYQSGYKTQTDGDVTWAMIYVLDSSTLAVMATYLLKDEADLYPISITANDNGDIAVVGQKYNEYRAIPITGYTGGTNYLAISKTVMGEHFPESGIPGDEYYNFFVQGTGINGQTQVSTVNYYPSVATTVREGSGAAFNIWNNGDGTYGWNGITYGTNYRVGHKIKLLGTDLGGTSPANDAIVTVTSINNDVQGGISSITISGTAAGVGPQVNYPGVTGTNYQVGSGARVNIGVDPVTDLITTVGTDNFGDYHYVVGDVLTVSGTIFPGGTSPANDVVLTVTDVYLGGGPNGYTVVSGTPPTGILRLNIDGYDFSTGTYTMRQSLNSEAFVWTPSWNQAIGGGGDDYFQSVIFGSDGTHIYAVGKGRYEVTYDQALVVKMTKGNGTIVWSKYVNSYLSPGSEVNASASSVIQLNNNNIVVSFSQYNNSFLSDEIGLVALDTNGDLQWTKTYLLDNGSPDSEHRLLRDGSNNIYVVFRGYNARYGDNAWNILKLDSTGNKIWARAITNNNMSMYFNYSWGNEFAALSNTHIYIAGYTYIPNDNNSTSLLIRFPVDGYKEFAEEGWARGESFGDLSIFKPTTITTTPVSTPQTFIPDVHQNGITTVANYNMGYVYTDEYRVPALLVKFTRDDLGYLEFGDGSKQSFATDRIPQILASNSQYIKLSPQDSGKHYFIGPDQAGVDFIIPEYDIEDPYPVGYTVTIVNCSGGDVYVNMYAPDNGNYYYGSIWGAGRDIQTRNWGIPDSGSGSLVTLMKVKNAQYSGGENESGPIWMIAGPSDIYNND